MELLNNTFQRPSDFKMQSNQLDHTAGDIFVHVLFDKEVSRWAQESLPCFAVSVEEAPEGLLMILPVRQENEIRQWLLGWGRHVHVLKPESLRQMLVAEAEAMILNYQKCKDLAK